MAEYDDVPAGFRVANTQQYSDVPQGFAVAPSGAPKTEAAMRRFVGPMLAQARPRASPGQIGAGVADVAISGARGLVNKPASSLAGLAGAINPNDTYFGAQQRFREGVARGEGIIGDERLRTPLGATVRTAMSLAPQSAGMQLLNAGLDAAGTGIEKTLGPEARDFAGSAAMLATLRTPAVMRAETGVARATAPRPVRAPAPTAGELRAAATDAYTSAENAGVVISRDAMSRIAREIKGELATEGIDATLHPDSMAALNRLIASGESPHSLKGAEILRRVIKDAEASTKPADARMASIMRDAFDERIEGLSGNDILTGESGFAMQSLQNARQLYSRARKAEDLDELFRRAELKAGANYTAAGIETALRQEFRSLAMNNRRLRGFTEAERAAIERVAKGGSIENGMRLLGKFTVSGPVSAAVSTGLGMMFGGPLGAVGLPAAGYLAKQRAAQLTTRNANAASELVRRGPTNALYSAPPTTSNALNRPR